MPDDQDDRELEELEASGEKHVPLFRFSQAVKERNDARRELAELREKAGLAEQLQTRITELEQTHTRAAAAWEEERGLITAGLTDPEAIDVARFLHSRLPEQERPPLADWVGQFREDPSKAPAALAGYLPTLEGAGADGAKGDEQQQGQGQGRRGLGSTRTGQRTDGAQRTGEPLSAAKIREIREQCQRTGDWEPWKKIRAQAYQ